jgi:hypothetical protein
MSGPMGLLLGLLLLAYLGRGRWGSPSGAEAVLLGLLLGPLILGVIESSWLVAFKPMFVVGASWLALIAGLGYGRSATQREAGLAFLGALLTGAVAVGVALVVWFLVAQRGLPQVEALSLAAGAGIVSSATTHHGLRWVVVRYNAQGPLTYALIDLTRLSPLWPAVGLALLCAEAPGTEFGTLPSAARFVLTLLLGAVLGVLAALLLGREFRKDESWGILLGTALLGSGICVRLGLSAVAALFGCGLTIALVSAQRAEIRSLLVPTHRAVLLPVALLAGASLPAMTWQHVALLTAVTLVARLSLDLVRGRIVVAFAKVKSNVSPWLGAGLFSTGGFTLAAALELNWRLGAELGGLLLWLAAIGNVLGEVLGPPLLRSALQRAGELQGLWRRPRPNSESLP